MNNSQYEEIYDDLKDIAETMGHPVKEVDHIKYGYIGNNRLAARTHHIKSCGRYIPIKKSLHIRTKVRTLLHEIAEIYKEHQCKHMKNLKKIYRKSHKFALGVEDIFG